MLGGSTSESAISCEFRRPEVPSQDRLRKCQCLSNSQRMVSGMSIHLHRDGALSGEDN